MTQKERWRQQRVLQTTVMKTSCLKWRLSALRTPTKFLAEETALAVFVLEDHREHFRLALRF